MKDRERLEPEVIFVLWFYCGRKGNNTDYFLLALVYKCVFMACLCVFCEIHYGECDNINSVMKLCLLSVWEAIGENKKETRVKHTSKHAKYISSLIPSCSQSHIQLPELLTGYGTVSI